MPLPQPISPHPQRAAGQDLLETWKEIAVYLNRDVRTVKRWERSRELPVHRLPGGARSAVYAMRSELDVWRQGARETSPQPPKATRKLPWLIARSGKRQRTDRHRASK